MAVPRQEMLFTDDIDGVHIREMLTTQKGLISSVGAYAARQYSFGGEQYERTGQVIEYPTQLDMAMMVSGWAAHYGGELTKVVISGWEDATVNPIQVQGWIQGLNYEYERANEAHISGVQHG